MSLCLSLSQRSSFRVVYISIYQLIHSAKIDLVSDVAIWEAHKFPSVFSSELRITVEVMASV